MSPHFAKKIFVGVDTRKETLSLFSVDLTDRIRMRRQSPGLATTIPDTNRENDNYVIPLSPDTPNLDPFSLANKLSRIADTIKWSRPLEKREFEKIAELATATAYDNSGAGPPS